MSSRRRKAWRPRLTSRCWTENARAGHPRAATRGHMYTVSPNMLVQSVGAICSVRGFARKRSGSPGDAGFFVIPTVMRRLLIEREPLTCISTHAPSSSPVFELHAVSMLRSEMMKRDATSSSRRPALDARRHAERVRSASK